MLTRTSLGRPYAFATFREPATSRQASVRGDGNSEGGNARKLDEVSECTLATRAATEMSPKTASIGARGAAPAGRIRSRGTGGAGGGAGGRGGAPGWSSAEARYGDASLCGTLREPRDRNSHRQNIVHLRVDIAP